MNGAGCRTERVTLKRTVIANRYATRVRNAVVAMPMLVPICSGSIHLGSHDMITIKQSGTMTFRT